MKTKLFLGTLMVTVAVGACGDDSAGPGGAGVTSSVSSTGSATSTVSTGGGGAGGDGTSGLPCTSDSQCNVSGDGTSFCSIDKLYNNNSYFPEPICIQTAACDLGDGMHVQPCDGNTGICIDSKGAGVCLPFCQFDDFGLAPQGNCPGNDACNWYGIGPDQNMASFGVGYCFGGCLKASDCPVAGEDCNIAVGLCMATASIIPPILVAGEGCMNDDDCTCGIAADQTQGMCLQFCKVGSPDNTCPPTTECDSALPAGGMVPFTKEPLGMAGNCVKTCSVPADCATGFCYASAGHQNMTCHFGPEQ